MIDEPGVIDSCHDLLLQPDKNRSRGSAPADAGDEESGRLLIQQQPRRRKRRPAV